MSSLVARTLRFTRPRDVSKLGGVLKRCYHSSEYPKAPPFPPTQDAILSAALSHVPAHGFTATALKAGARDAGYLDITANLFPQGVVALVNYHLVTQRLALADHFSSPLSSPPSSRPPSSNPGEQSNSLDIPSKIHAITLRRLHANRPIIQHWQSALAILSLPPNVPLSVRELALLADEILYLAGSKTVSGAWYTDRAGLATLYASAELYMTQDRSKDFVETEQYVKRWLDEANGWRQGMDMFGTWVRGQAGGFVDGLRSKSVWI